MPTREQEYNQVRELLDYPKEQCPRPDAIVHGLIRQEQFQSNKLNRTAKGWTVATTTVTTVANQAEYEVNPQSKSSQDAFGKALYVYRILENNVLLPIPFTDFTSEINNPGYDFWVAPYQSGLAPPFSGEKVAFFRTERPEKIKMRIYPAPVDAALIYQITYATGWRDWTQFDWSDVPLLQEWSNFRCLATALFELPKAEWDGYSRQENTEKRRELKESLSAQFSMQEDEFNTFIRNPQHEPDDEIGYWYGG